jgi:hypothetical protein
MTDGDDSRDDDNAADAEAPQWSRADLELLRQAGRQRWAVPDQVKAEALYQLARLVSSATTADRDRLGAARTLALLDRIDQADERQALERTRIEIRISATQGVLERGIDPAIAAAALAAASAALVEREAAGGEGG